MRNQVDPITLELVKNALSTINDEMIAVIVRTARSPVIKNTQDFLTSIHTEQGESVALGGSLPVGYGSMSVAAKEIIKKYGSNIFPGDVYILNDPYGGGSHLPDIKIYMPVFHNKKLIAFVGNFCHHADIGGRVPGGNATDSLNIYQEGLRIPLQKWYSKGTLNMALKEIIQANVRLPDDVFADLQSQVSAVKTGVKRLQELADRYGADYFRHCLSELLDYSEKMVRGEIEAIPDGVYEAEDQLEGDGIEKVRIPMRLKVIVEGSSITVDLTEYPPQVKGSINCPFGDLRGIVFASIREMLRGNIFNNDGMMRPITILTKPGTIVNPTLPAAVGGRAITLCRTMTTIGLALSKAIPDRVCAASQDTPMATIMGGTRPNGEPFVFVSFLIVGSGGRPTMDGLESCVLLSIASAEVLERELPVVIEECGYVADTGGAGKYRGGLSVRYTVRLLADEAQTQIRADRREGLCYGLQGGKEGTPSWAYLIRPGGEQVLLPPFSIFGLKKGEATKVITPGGGGWGDPLEREPAQVFEDTVDEKFTLDYVRKEYGVVIDGNTKHLDLTATAKLRQHVRHHC